MLISRVCWPVKKARGTSLFAAICAIPSGALSNAIS
jgi:hypothetical protein